MGYCLSSVWSKKNKKDDLKRKITFFNIPYGFCLLPSFFVAVATGAMRRFFARRVAHVNVRKRAITAVYVELTLVDAATDTAVDFFLFHA
jgi:hypothetical protein